MTPAELKVKIDAALDENPAAILVPYPLSSQARFSENDHCNCLLGVVYCAPWPANDEVDEDTLLTTGEQHNAFAYGFDRGELPEKRDGYSGRACENHPDFFDLGKSYRSHPRCILTQEGGANV